MAKRRTKNQPLQILIGYRAGLLPRERAVTMLVEYGLDTEQAAAYLDKPTPNLIFVKA
jgi:hypothetical protein